MRDKPKTATEFAIDAIINSALIGAQRPKARQRLAESLMLEATRLAETSDVLHLCDLDPHAGAKARRDAARLLLKILARWPALQGALNRGDQLTVEAVAAAERQLAGGR